MQNDSIQALKPAVWILGLPEWLDSLDACLAALGPWADEVHVVAPESLSIAGVSWHPLNAEHPWQPAFAAPGHRLLLQADELLQTPVWPAAVSGFGWCAIHEGDWQCLEPRWLAADAPACVPQGPRPWLQLEVPLTAPPLEIRLERRQAATGLARVRQLQQQGQSQAARTALASLTQGQETTQASLHKKIRIVRRVAPPPADAETLRLVLCLSDLGQSAAQLEALLETQCRQLPALAASPEARLLRAEIAWRGDRYRLAADGFAAAVGPEPGWRWPAFHEQLPTLRRHLLELMADAPVAADSLRNLLPGLTAAPLLLDALYGLFLLSQEPLPAAALERLSGCLGTLPPLLRLAVSSRDQGIQAETLALHLPRHELNALERRVMVSLLEQLSASEREPLLNQLLRRKPGPEWLWAQARLRCEQAGPAAALPLWHALANSAEDLPGWLLSRTAAALTEQGQVDDARRCLERALTAAPSAADSVLTRRLEALLAERPFTRLIRLPARLDWEQGGDLALKACFETFAATDGVLLHCPGEWRQPILEQALAWSRSRPAPALPPLWCGPLPERWQTLPPVRLLPRRQLSLETELDRAEIQPLPPTPAAGPLYTFAQDPQRRQIWVETDADSLQRWLRAAGQQTLPNQAVPLLRNADWPELLRPRTSLALIRRPEHLPERGLIGSFGEIRVAEAGESLMEAGRRAASDWCLLLENACELSVGCLGYLQGLLNTLPPAIQAVALGGRLRSRPREIWPALRLLRRSALGDLAAGGFACLAAPAREIWHVPEISLVYAALVSGNELDRAWQAWLQEDFDAALRCCDAAAAAWPEHAQVLASLEGLRARCHAARADWSAVLALAEAPLPILALSRSQALEALGQPERAGEEQARARRWAAQLQPDVCDLFPFDATLLWRREVSRI